MLFLEKHSCSSGFYVRAGRQLCDKAKYRRPFSVIKPHHRQLVRENLAPNNRAVLAGSQHTTHTHTIPLPGRYIPSKETLTTGSKSPGPKLYYKVSSIPKQRSTPCKLVIPKEHKRPAQKLIFLWASTEHQT